MRLKILLSHLIFYLIIFQANGQILQCKEVINPIQIDETIYTHHTARTSNNNTQYVLNVFFHIVRDDNGNSPAIPDEQIQDAVAMLNIAFNDFDIFFKYMGYDYIDDSSLLSLNINEFNTLQNLPQFRNNALNLFIVDEVTSNNGNLYAGLAQRPGIKSAFTASYFLSATLPHEIGHNLNLYHTYEGWNTQNCEHVDQANHPNCEVAGDYVCDTPASYKVPSGDVVYLNGDFYYQNNSNTTDCLGDIYVNVPIKNFMSNNIYQLNNYYRNLRDHFTPGQGVRMRETIENIPSIFGSIRNTVESLYEPFDVHIEVDYDWVLSETQNHDGTVTTCYGEKIVHVFQKGFDYDFYKWEGGDASNSTFEYSVGRLQLPVNELPLQAVKINQVSNTNIIVFESSAGIRPNPTAHCTTARPNSGKVITSNLDGSNATIRDMNNQELQSSDDEIIQTLESNKRHTLIKDYDNGERKEKTVFKTN